jgi:dolichyl-phosphate beta-glucosyltransferase
MASRGELVLFLDADGSSAIEDEVRLRRAIADGADIAIGSRASSSKGKNIRYMQGPYWAVSSPIDGTSWIIRPHRWLLGRVFASFTESLLGLGIHDTQCGFKMMRGECARALFSRLRTEGFAFDVEVLNLAKRSGLSIAEIPIDWHDVSGGKLSLLRDPVVMFVDLLRMALVCSKCPIVHPYRFQIGAREDR